MKDENKPTAAATLSLVSGVLFLYTALLLRIPQPFNLMMVSSVITIFAAMLMYAHPQHRRLYGAIVIVTSLLSLLAMEIGAPWRYLNPHQRWNYFGSPLGLYIFYGILSVTFGIFGGVWAITPKIFEVQIGQTPDAFMKKCVDCGEKIPIASEQCPHCNSRQNRQK